MVTEPRFLLTTKDHAILQAMYDQHHGPHGPYEQLLGRKLRASAIAFSDDLPPGMVTLGSRFSYRVNGTLVGPQVLIQGEVANLPDFAISVHSLRGLALLGLAERSALVLDLGNGNTEELRVEDVLSQPDSGAGAATWSGLPRTRAAAMPMSSASAARSRIPRRPVPVPTTTIPDRAPPEPGTG